MTTPSHEDRPTAEPTTLIQPGPAGEPAPPERVGPYRLLDRLAKGGMGVVYRAEHLHLKRHVALKLLPADNTHDPALLLRFLKEMEALGPLRHPNLVAATDAGQAEGRYFLVMELLDGLDLARLATRLGPLPVAEACELVRQAAVGLHWLHERGFVHRDVKPSNLFLTADGVVKVLDLGLAHWRRDPGHDERLTPTGMILGTGDYIAPEQAQDPRCPDRRADLYSLGCTLYRLLAGRAPFGEPRFDTLFKKLQAHVQETAPPLSAFRTEVPTELVVLVDRLLAKNVAERPPDADRVAATLAGFTPGHGVVSLLARARVPAANEPAGPPLAPITRQETPRPPHEETKEPRALVPRESVPVPPVPRRRRWWLAGASALLAGLALLVWLNWRPPEPPPKGPAGEVPPSHEDAAPPPVEWPLGKWHSLLRREPSRVLWPSDSRDSSFHLDEQGERLEVATTQMVMLGLGTVSDADYRIRLLMRQPTWAGGVGVFLGRREGVHEGRPCVRYQLIKLGPHLRKDPEKAFAFYREKFVPSGEGLRGSLHRGLGLAAIKQPGHRPYTFELVVRNGRLAQALWDGVELPGLTSPGANADFDAADYQGTFGVFVNAAAASFSNCEILVEERGNP